MNEEEKKVFNEHLETTNRCINHLVKINKTLIILGIVAIICIASMHAMTLWYLYQYDYSIETVTTTTEVTQSSEGGGDANYIGKDGNISYGEAESKNIDTKNH